MDLNLPPKDFAMHDMHLDLNAFPEDEPEAPIIPQPAQDLGQISFQQTSGPSNLLSDSLVDNYQGNVASVGEDVVVQPPNDEVQPNLILALLAHPFMGMMNEEAALLPTDLLQEIQEPCHYEGKSRARLP
jgi:hypothetical protein